MKHWSEFLAVDKREVQSLTSKIIICNRNLKLHYEDRQQTEIILNEIQEHESKITKVLQFHFNSKNVTAILENAKLQSIKQLKNNDL